MIDGRQRKNVKIGLFVEIIQKPHQRTGELTEGVINYLIGILISYSFLLLLLSLFSLNQVLCSFSSL